MTETVAGLLRQAADMMEEEQRNGQPAGKGRRPGRPPRTGKQGRRMDRARRELQVLELVHAAGQPCDGRQMLYSGWVPEQIANEILVELVAAGTVEQVGTTRHRKPIVQCVCGRCRAERKELGR